MPDFQHAKTLILEVDGKEPETIECPVDINGFEYEIQGSKQMRKASGNSSQ